MPALGERKAQSSDIAFHEKAGLSQHFFAAESPLSPSFHPQSLMSFVLAASWAFSFQPVLQPVRRPLLHLGR
jgi:hypothetical protein